MSFIRNYLKYCEGNEAPPLYHMWTCISVLSAVVSRRVWVNQGYWTWYPNMYVVLVGPPGAAKSTALDIGKNFLRATGKVPMAADASTTQALMRRLSGADLRENQVNPYARNFKHPETGAIVEYTPCTIMAGELVNFIGMDPYGWVIFLTTVFHEEVHEVDTKNKGHDLIKGPYITLLGALTPDTSANMLQQRIISSGFARRTIFVWASQRGDPIAFPEITKEQDEAMKACKQRAQELQSIKGEFKWTDAARKWYEPWYCQLQKNLARISVPSTSGYYSSKHVQLIKTSMLMALSESDELVLDVPHLELALHFLELTEPHLPRIFEGSGRNEDAGVALAIYEYLEQIRDGVPLKKVYATFYGQTTGGRQGVEQIIHHLVASDKVFRWNDNVNGVSQELIATAEGRKNFDANRRARAGTPPTPSPASGSNGGFAATPGQPSLPSLGNGKDSSPAGPGVP